MNLESIPTEQSRIMILGHIETKKNHNYYYYLIHKNYTKIFKSYIKNYIHKNTHNYLIHTNCQYLRTPHHRHTSFPESATGRTELEPRFPGNITTHGIPFRRGIGRTQETRISAQGFARVPIDLRSAIFALPPSSRALPGLCAIRLSIHRRNIEPSTTHRNLRLVVEV